jgi:LPPG:FO 2-phospho-L-lactate transferase
MWSLVAARLRRPGARSDLHDPVSQPISTIGSVTLLCGGVGGAKLALGLQDVLPPGSLTVIGNVGDDEEILGLHISPDLDSVLYALAGLNDTDRGWGREGETWRALESARGWGADTWFALGDLDLGLHLVRSLALRAGEPLSVVTRRFSEQAALPTLLLPATDDPVRTHVLVDAIGWLAFQDWFVGRGHRDDVIALEYRGAADARPAPGVLEAIRDADTLLFAPSNPYISILPILAVPGIHQAVTSRTAPLVAVSPIVGGKSIKGPLDRMLQQLAGGTSPRHVTDCYKGLVDILVVDHADAAAEAATPLVPAETLMTDRDSAALLARIVLEAAR